MNRKIVIHKLKLWNKIIKWIPKDEKIPNQEIKKSQYRKLESSISKQTEEKHKLSKFIVWNISFLLEIFN